MKNNKSRFWAGALSTLLLGWLAFGFTIWLSGEILQRDPSPGSDYMYLPNIWFALAILLLWLSALASISFVCGAFCAFFWRDIADKNTYDSSGFWLFPLILLPSMLLCGLGIIAFFPCLPLYYKGTDFGNKWWPQKRYRHFFGLSNDWERDSED